MFADVSHHQSVDLAAYFAEYDRIAQKVTEATAYEDPTFAPRYAYCRAHGRPFIGYHFDRAAFSGVDQWDWFESRIRRAGGPRPYPLDLWILDSEDTHNPAAAVTSAKQFVGRAVARGFDQGGVYSGLWYAKPHGIRLDMLPAGWRRGWLSDYNAAHGDTTMPLPPGWLRSQLIARQFTNAESMDGVASRCDANRVLFDWTEEEEMPTLKEFDELLCRRLRLRGGTQDVPIDDVGDVLLRFAQLLLRGEANRSFSPADAAGFAGSDVRSVVSALTAKVEAVDTKIDALVARLGLPEAPSPK